MLVTYLQGLVSKKINDQTIRGYRGGYLPSERRTIEKKKKFVYNYRWWKRIEEFVQ